NGPKKSRPIAATTSKTATTSAALIHRLGTGRAQASPSAHARFDSRRVSHAPAPRQARLAARKMGWEGASPVRLLIQAPLTPRPNRTSGMMQHDAAASAPSNPPNASIAGPRPKSLPVL